MLWASVIMVLLDFLLQLLLFPLDPTYLVAAADSPDGDIFGVIMLIVGILLMVGEMFVPGGFFGSIGFAILVVGIVILFLSPTWWQVFWIFLAALGIAYPVSLIGARYLMKHSNLIDVNQEVVGKTGVVEKEVMEVHGSGKVRVGGEIWSALLDAGEGNLKPGDSIEVVRQKGVHLIVRRR